MKGLAKEQLSAGIVKWLPRGHIITTESESENALVVGWMNRLGTTSVVTVTFEQIVVDDIQTAIEKHDENLVESYLEQIESEMLRMATLHDDGDTQPWNVTPNIFTNDSAQR